MYQAVFIDEKFVGLFAAAFLLMFINFGLMRVPLTRSFFTRHVTAARVMGAAIMSCSLLLSIGTIVALSKGAKSPVAPALVAYGICTLFYTGWMIMLLPTMIEMTKPGGPIARVLQKLR
ncbi:MAG: hypothetical protein JO261_10960 [Alphaproteobacteria bacterium]|nr:hypothetical protein [Alphaproteobacteria bacterium]MBV9694206.1 hypothetical protein [Alphaproteobacteria bacterium]